MNLPASVGAVRDVVQSLWMFEREGLTTEVYRPNKYWPIAHWVFWGEHPQLRFHPLKDTFLLVLGRHGMTNLLGPVSAIVIYTRASQVVLVAKNPAANAGDVRHSGLIPESGRCPGGGNGNPLQYSCLESPKDRGAWWATVIGIANTGIWLSPHTVTYT